MRIALGVSYNGAPFCGWQSQPGAGGVQDRLEAALTAVAAEPVRVAAAGRTDAGVHATGQVVHFDTEARRPLNAWVRGVNAHLEPAIAVQWACPVDERFHARFSATARRYHYLLACGPVRPSLLDGLVGWTHRPLALEPMRAAAACLIGRHDFSSFRAAACQARSPVRELRTLGIAQRGPYLLMEFVADAFLHHMVRNLVGALVRVGSGAAAPEWVGELLALRDRRRGAPTFAPQGLYLTGVQYPAPWDGFAPAALPWLLDGGGPIGPGGL
jgi:tRNA pseudouridine38-40 synthase